MCRAVIFAPGLLLRDRSLAGLASRNRGPPPIFSMPRSAGTGWPGGSGYATPWSRAIDVRCGNSGDVLINFFQAAGLFE